MPQPSYHRLVADLTAQEAQRRAEQELSKLTVEDWQNLLIVGGISLFGVWVMTVRPRDAGEEPDEEDVCALCGYAIDPTEGARFLGPAAQRRLGVHPGEAVCRRCLSAYGGR